MHNNIVKRLIVRYVLRDVLFFLWYCDIMFLTTEERMRLTVYRQLICLVCQRQLLVLILKITVEVRFEAYSGGYEEFCLLTYNAM
jgi:hypothetical protein